MGRNLNNGTWMSVRWARMIVLRGPRVRIRLKHTSVTVIAAIPLTVRRASTRMNALSVWTRVVRMRRVRIFPVRFPALAMTGMLVMVSPASQHLMEYVRWGRLFPRRAMRVFWPFVGGQFLLQRYLGYDVCASGF